MESKYLFQGSKTLFPEGSTELEIGGIVDRVNFKLEEILDRYMKRQKEILQGGKLTERGKKEELGEAFRTARDGIKAVHRQELAQLQSRIEKVEKDLGGDEEIALGEVAPPNAAPVRQADLANRIGWYRTYYAENLTRDSATAAALLQSSIEEGKLEEAGLQLFALQTAPVTVALQVKTLNLPELIRRFREKRDPERYAGLQALQNVLTACRASQGMGLRHLEKTSGAQAGGVSPDTLTAQAVSGGLS